MATDDRLISVSGERLDRSAIGAFLNQNTPIRLIDCNLEEADLSRLDLTGWHFEKCVCRNVKMTGATLVNSTWKGCRGGVADFAGASLNEAVLQSCDFNNGNFRGASLTSATFQSCKMIGADLSEARHLNVTFEEILFADAKLPNFSFRKARLRQIDFGQADLRKCDFRDAWFEECSLRDANLRDARFDGADLRGADLGGIRLMDAKQFKGATISRAQASQLLSELGIHVR
ncbi:pentapeptide repeat-containing protein [Microvirga alba]|uniref:Pentapeptide repeat-containing protein n=1 Tax=Microvirga alba TaxID=2791025 RepID=A0A931BLI6_9HYPH|nr:pentapeptide repeat-containing protein [Microvirga alba]MBF9233111.1 pentapeptide repeat-containing protein [Microvirga alba]